MNSLVVLLGPTGVGKTELSLRLAEYFRTPILSSDSRQLYRDLVIGTAAPTAGQLQRVKHYFVGTLGLDEYYNASRFEEDVIALLKELHASHPLVLMTGGSMMYIDAVCKGIDDLPTVSPELRKELTDLYLREGLDPIRARLKLLDPEHYAQVDLKNHKRVIHALEICLMTGRPYSALRTQSRKPRPFQILKIGINRDRDELYDRINRRVDRMMADGLLEEARRVYPFRHLNALNTVGYKELFRYFDGEWTLDFAVEKIKQDSRNYARKQLTWFRRDPEIVWFRPEEEEAIRHYIETKHATR